MSDIFDQLKAEFPRNAVSWRAQSMKQDGTAALALAYIDARDVMNRLDDVCGPGGWQDRYEVHGPKTICYLSVRVDGEWVTKADGAGDTDVEAEKGSISDAFKRAAVKWGIGRYLYDLDAPWVACKSRAGSNGKLYWQSWSEDPWSKVKNSSSAPVVGRNAPAAARTSAVGAPPSEAYKVALAAMKLSRSKAELSEWWAANKANIGASMPDSESLILVGERNTLAQTLPAVFQEAAG